MNGNNGYAGNDITPEILNYSELCTNREISCGFWLPLTRELASETRLRERKTRNSH